jgi:hypothetical protein
LTNLLAEEDRRFLNEMKQALRRGLQAFESHERHALDYGHQQLLDALTSVPDVLGGYYERVALQVEDLPDA